MVNPASLLSAISATIAAVLVAVNLYVSGRREHNRWARDVLIDVFVTFLNAGFDGSAACRKLIDSRGPAGREDMTTYRSRIAAAHKTETEMLTKMRLLAGPAVVEAAMRLHLAAHAYVALTDLEPPQPSPEEVDETHARMWEARRSFLTVAKVEIGLRPEVSSVTHAPF